MAVRENYVCLGPAPQGVKIDSLWLMTRHLNAKSSIPCVHGIDCIKITFPLCLSMDMVLAWSAASEDSGTEPESVALNKSQTRRPRVWMQRIGNTEKWSGNGVWRAWFPFCCNRFRLHFLKWMGLHYEVMYSETQTKFWGVCWLYITKVLSGRTVWQLNTHVTVTL